MDIEYLWIDSRTADHLLYTCNLYDPEKDTNFTINLAGVRADGRHFRVVTGPLFDDLIPPGSYIRNKRYATLLTAQRAVERKIPPLVAVLLMQGVLP